MDKISATGRQEVNVPAWVPKSARLYLAHTERGTSIRALARSTGCHASTVLRQIRRCETRRDDFLVDEALRRLGNHVKPGRSDCPPATETPMTHMTPQETSTLSNERLDQEARRVLRRLCETGAVLAVAADMDMAVVVRATPSGTQTRTAVVGQDVAQAMALKNWIACDAPGRVSRYAITAEGRNALAGLLARAGERGGDGFAEAPMPFDHASGGETGAPVNRRVRYSPPESPLTLLARRKDRDGTPFLDDDLVHAGERLREDFELAQMGERVTQNWDHFLTGGVRGDAGQAGMAGGSEARARGLCSA